MVRHIVLTKFKADVPEEQINTIYSGLTDLTHELPGAQGFTGGRSESPEHMERGYMHGFIIDFDSWEALQIYADDPRHKALGTQLVNNAIGGIDGILVLDINV